MRIAFTNDDGFTHVMEADDIYAYRNDSSKKYIVVALVRNRSVRISTKFDCIEEANKCVETLYRTGKWNCRV